MFTFRLVMWAIQSVLNADDISLTVIDFSFIINEGLMICEL